LRTGTVNPADLMFGGMEKPGPGSNEHTLAVFHSLPHKRFHDVLEPRAQALVKHDDETFRAFAGETLKETEIFRRSQGSYGHVFYVLQRT